MSKPVIVIASNILSPYRVRLYRLLGEHFAVRVVVSGEEADRDWPLEEVARDLNVRRTPALLLPQARGAVLHVNPALLLDLIRLRPDAIVTNEMGFRSLVALVYGILARVPVWVWWGGTVHTEKRHATRGRRVLRNLVFKRLVRRWISYGATSTEYLQSLGVPLGRVLEIRNFADDVVFRRADEPAPLPARHPRILCVSRLVAGKGHRYLLEAAAALQAEGLQFSLVLVGRGPEEPRVRARIEELGLRDVHLIGSVPYADMPAIYRACDAMIFPSLEDPWGLVVNEAILTGTPLVSSIYAGCTPELVPPIDHFDPLDPDSITAALRRCVLGQVEPLSLDRLMSVEQVTQVLSREIDRGLQGDVQAIPGLR